MNVDKIFSDLDSAFNENDLVKAECILKSGIEAAASEGDSASLLQILNEYIGFLRTMTRYDEAFAVGGEIKKLLHAMGLEGSIPYATSLLNIATAKRAGGDYEGSLEDYEEVEKIYQKSLPENSMLIASYYNNKSLLFQEMGNLEASIDCLDKALKIAIANGEGYETAVSYANLANSYVGLHKFPEAYRAAEASANLFEELEAFDSHYASSLYVLGICENNNGNGVKASGYLNKALELMENNLGKNEFYYRIQDELKNCSDRDTFIPGMELAKGYYEEIVKPALEAKFSSYVNKIAVGLVGRGSDCFMFDDASSMDHDWGPGLCLWVTTETFKEIGKDLSDFYASLPDTYRGFTRGPIVSGHRRKGVFVIEDFYRDLLGEWPPVHFEYINDYSLAAAVNGEVFTDPEGIFTEYRHKLLKGYPESLLYKKIAESASKFCQAAMYNLPRMLNRGDNVTASIMLADGLKEAMKLAHYIENKYPPHDKWLFKNLENLSMSEDIIPLVRLALETGSVDALSKFFANTMYTYGYISDIDDYLDHHAAELLFKAGVCELTINELVKKIVALEFEAFDKVQNEGGRADCQDDWMTFSKMRKSQYLTWNKQMLVQYIYDFDREYKLGHNLITEKYGRMMASTAPLKYAEIKDHFPKIPPEKAAVIEAIVEIQVNWMEDFSEHYPKLSGRARSIHSFEDTPYNTSYETYLRGEISTYSDKMLQLYAQFISGKLSAGDNLAYEIMSNNVSLYGYKNLDQAEEKA